MNTMLPIYACATALVMIGGWAAMDAHRYGPHMVVPKSFSIAIALGKNERGDFQYACQSQYCQESDDFIGVQSHLFYHTKTNAMAGIPVSPKPLTVSAIKELQK